MKDKVRQAKNGKLPTEEVQHLKRRGINITTKINSINKRPIRRLTSWWEATTVEKFLEDVEFLLENSAFLSIVTLLAEITIITSLFGWWIGRTERRENEIFSTWQIVNSAAEDQSGVTKLALERLLRNNFSLAGVDLNSSNLSSANLQTANLELAELQESNLSDTNLSGANLSGANLSGANSIESQPIRC